MTEDEREQVAQLIQTALIGERPTYLGDAGIAGQASHIAWTAMEAVEGFVAERESALRASLAQDIMKIPLAGDAPVLRLAADIVLGKYRIR